MASARLAVSRHAGELFWKQGVEGTSGDDIAAAAGLSTRTIWRYFRSKEACAEPLLQAGELRFVALLRQWPRELSIEDHLRVTMVSFLQDETAVRDGIAAARLLALLPGEPALRAAWLMACSQSEAEFVEIVAARAGLRADDFEARLCAAAMMAALRVVDETTSDAAINHGRRFDLDDITGRVATAMRAASTLPICDPVD